MATKTTLKLDQDVIDVLESSTITETSLTLPNRQLERKLYEKVNKVLTMAGGKWNRGKGAHLFPKDPREALGLAVSNGEMDDKKKRLQQYFTPPAVAIKAIEQLDIHDWQNTDVLEPSCGNGAMLKALKAAGLDMTNVNATEIDPVMAKEAARVLGSEEQVLVNDFLQTPPMAIYDRVLMNPPFSNGQDMDHVTHALKYVRPGGRLVAIMSPSWTFVENKKAVAFRKLVHGLGSDWIELPPNSFKESETGVNTGMLVIQL